MLSYFASVMQFVTTLAVVFGVYLSWQSKRAITAVKHNTDGMKDELVREVRASAKAQGVKEGKAEAAEASLFPPPYSPDRL